MRLEALLTDIPESRLDALEIIRDAGCDAREAEGFTALFGMRSVACEQRPHSTLARLDRFLEGLGSRATLLLPEALFHVHAQPTGTADRLPARQALAGRHAALARLAYQQEIDQFNCAGIFFALAAAERLFAARQASAVLILAGDSFHGWEPRHRYLRGCTLLGDAFVALLLSTRPGGVQIDSVVPRYHSEFAGGLNAPAAELRQFNARHVDLICEALGEMPAPLSAAGQLLPHNINGLAWRLFERRRLLAADRLRLDLLPEIGHCCTTDPFLLLRRLLDEQESRPVPEATLMSIGMGGFTGTARCTISPQETPHPP